MGDSTPSTSAVVSPNQARALKNSFLWNFQFHMKEEFDYIDWPASDAGREAWTEFYEVFASELEEVCGVEAVSATLEYCIKHKKKGELAKAQPAPAAPTVTDPKAIAAQRFASGQIDVTTFTEIVAALNAAGVTAAPVGDNIPQEAAKESAEESAEEAAPTPFVPILVEDEDVDLPF
jgi:hypothetical protein